MVNKAGKYILWRIISLGWGRLKSNICLRVTKCDLKLWANTPVYYFFKNKNSLLLKAKIISKHYGKNILKEKINTPVDQWPGLLLNFIIYYKLKFKTSSKDNFISFNKTLTVIVKSILDKFDFIQQYFIQGCRKHIYNVITCDISILQRKEEKSKNIVCYLNNLFYCAMLEKD